MDEDREYHIEIDPGVPLPPDLPLERIGQLAARVMAGEEVPSDTTLGLRFCDDEEIQSLNRDFLGHDEPTDVLSFGGEPEDFPEQPGEDSLLGDLVISLPTAERQAEAIGHSLAAEVDHLLVHGILHLCGYEHEDTEDAERRMREREEQYLGDLGYIHGDAKS